MGIFGSSDSSKTNTVDNTPVTSSKQNDPIPVGMGQFKASQCLLWKGPVQEQQQPSQGKGGGKGADSYLYYAPVMAALCNGPITSIGEVWVNQTWLSSANGAEGITVVSHYSPQNYALLIADNGVTLANTYSSTYTDYGLPASTVLSGTDNAPMEYIPWFISGTAYAVGNQVFNGTDVYTCKKSNSGEALSNATYWTNSGSGLATGQYSITGFSLGTITLSSVANAAGGNTVYTGSSIALTGFSGASGGLVGFRFVVTGFSNPANNGTFICTASTATTLTLNNALGVAQTHAGAAEDVGQTYHFSTADLGKTSTVWYQFNYSLITEQDTVIVPSSAPIGGTSIPYSAQLSNQYTPTQVISVQYFGEDNPSAGVSLTQVYSTPTVTGTYQFFTAGTVGGQSHITYVRFAPGDLDQEMLVTWGYTNQSAVGQTAPELINFTMFGGNMGQPVLADLESGGVWQLGGGSANVASGSAPGNPAEALAYTGIGGVFYFPMFLGDSGQVQDNTFEVLTPDSYGGGITDCNPVWCVQRVLTDSRWGFGSGAVPFPVSAIDNGSSGTWGGPAGTPGSRQVGSTAWNFATANNFFISPYISDHTSAASEMAKWLEAGQICAFMSEGLLKLVGNGSQSAANNGCTWIAPQDYIVAFDDTCFIPESEGKDPVKLTRKTYLDGYNKVQIGYSNRDNQYEDDTVPESDQASINRWGLRCEDPQSWSFIRTQAAATFAASMRVKKYVTLRNEYTFTVPYIYGYVEPMDVVTITTSSSWAAGLNNANSNIMTLPVQITKKVDDPQKGITFTCEDYIAPAKLPTFYNKSISTATGSVNQWVNPGNSEVVMFECTARMSQQTGNTIAIGACGTSSNWGGCNIWVSYDGETYKQVGTIKTPARIGVLYDNLATGSDPDTTNTMAVEMVENSGALDAGSDSDADNLTTSCVVGGASNEIIGFSTATVTGDDQYTLGLQGSPATGYMRRGQLGTSIASHAAGSPFMIMDESVFYYQYDPIWAGQTLYFKFQSFNTFGNANQLLSSLTATTFTVPGLNPGTIDASSGIVLNTPANTVGAGPLGWNPIYGPAAYAASINFGNYGYAGMNTNVAGLTTYLYTRLVGYLVPSVTGEYNLGTNYDDGATLYIGDQVCGANALATVGAMSANLTAKTAAQILLTAGVYYPIVIEWAQGVGNYGLQLLWSPPKASSPVLVPAANLSTSNTTITGSLEISVWQGTAGLYYPTGQGLTDPANKLLYGPPTNGGGTNVVNGVTAVSATMASDPGLAPNSFFGPGWITGQAWSSGGIIDVLLCYSLTSGYMFRMDFRSGAPIGYIMNATNITTSSWTGPLGTTYIGNNAAAVTGWVNFAIYITLSGYMAFWINNVLAADVTDRTYPNATSGNGLKYGYELSAGKIAPVPNAAGAGSTALNSQGSICTISDYTFSYTSTSSTITWSWTAFDVYCPDGSTYAVAASTGSATTYTNVSTTVSGTTPMKWTGLAASATYYFTPFVILNSNGTGTVAMMITGGSQPSLTQQVQNCNADGCTPCSASIFVTAMTGASGGGTGGGSGGGSGHACFSPNTKVKTQRGDIAIIDLIAGEDKVLTARGTWKGVLEVTTRSWSGAMLDMGADELSTLGHLVKNGTWKRMAELGRFSVVRYEGTIHNLHVHCDWEDDGSELDTEHSYTLANGLVVHNIQTAI